MSNTLLPSVVMTASLWLASSCNDVGTSVNKLELSGTYTYKGYDTSGVLTSIGTLVLKDVDSQIAGKLTIERSGQADSLEGRFVEPDTIELFSNPHQAVAYYVRWSGIRRDGSIQGEIFSESPTQAWQLWNGSFVAVKVSD